MAKDYFSKRDKSLGITWAKLHQYIFLKRENSLYSKKSNKMSKK